MSEIESIFRNAQYFGSHCGECAWYNWTWCRCALNDFPGCQIRTLDTDASKCTDKFVCNLKGKQNENYLRNAQSGYGSRVSGRQETDDASGYQMAEVVG
jgi:hypothetical protein